MSIKPIKQNSAIKISRLVHILKQAILYSALLNDYEKDIVADRCKGYSEFGDKVRVTAKQAEVLEEIAQKLCL